MEYINESNPFSGKSKTTTQGHDQ